MNKKILIGSIVIVTVFIGVSFTSVVSYGSVKSTSELNSPLFDIRSQRAIGQGQQDISTDYLGHGEESNIPLSGRTKRAEQVRKVIDIISKMDDKAFNKIVMLIINQNQMTRKETSDVLEALNYIKRNPEEMKYFDKNNVGVTFLITCVETLKYLTCLESPGCLIKMISFLFLGIYIWIAATITPSGCNCATMITGFCCDNL